MSVSVYIPTSFRVATDGQARIEVEATDVGMALDGLERRFVGLRSLVRDADGRWHPHVGVFVNGEEIGDLCGRQTLLSPGDEVSLIPALAGGSGACS